MGKLELRLSWKQIILISIPFILGVALLRIKAAHDRAYIPILNILVPKSSPIGQTASALAFSPDSQMLAVADTQGQMWVWNIAKRKFESHFRHGSGDTIDSLIWGKNNLLVIGNSDSIRAFKVPIGIFKIKIPVNGESQSFQYYLDHYCLSVVSPRATLAVFGQVNGTISVWNTISGKRYFILKAPNRETCGVALSDDDKSLAVASLLVKPVSSTDDPQFGRQSGIEIALRDAHTGKVQANVRWDNAEIERTTNFEGNLGDIGLAFSPDGKKLAGANTAGFALWDVSSGQLIRSFEDKNVSPWGSRKCISFSPDGSTVAAAGYGENIYVWSVETGKQLQAFHGSAFTNALTFSADGRFLATGGQDKGASGVVKIWDVQSLK